MSSPLRPAARREDPPLPHDDRSTRGRSRVAARAAAVLGAGGVSIAVVMLLIAALAADMGAAVSTAKPDKILLAPLSTRSVVYDSAGGEMALLYAEQDRVEVSLDQVPREVRTAVLTIEDDDFYRHHGVNLSSGLRALFSDLSAGGVEQGGSTITQQLIKNSITGSRQTLERKINEAILATHLEDQMSKDDILERYLNTVYLGHGAYGVQAASETYFDKSVDELGWPEAALLASLIRNPVGYDPISFPEVSEQRRALVVRRLLETEKISQAEATSILETPLPAKVVQRAAKASKAELVGGSYFAEEVKQYLLDLPALGDTKEERIAAVFEGGLRVYTTYDPEAQRQAEAAVTKVPDSGGKFFTGVASVDARTGAVRAMVGGPDFATNKTNYVTQGWRQPGSSFKFFVLLAALEAGYIPTDSISGVAPCRFPDAGSPKGVYAGNNSHGSGSVADLTSQTAQSSNCAYLRLGQTVGLDKVADLANALGVSTITAAGAEGGGYQEIPIPSDIVTLPIGTKEVHPLDMAAAYAVAANDGRYNPPYYVERITDARGAVLYEHRSEERQVVSVQTARLAAQVLAKNVTGGTGRKAALKRQVAAGKTGTTDDHADIWFVGFTPYLSTAVWIGDPNGLATVRLNGSDIFGGDYPAAVWGAFNTAYHQSRPPVAFSKPAPATRKGRLIKYRNAVDRAIPKGTKNPSSNGKSTTTTVPPSGAGGGAGGAPVTAPPATSPPATAPPATAPPPTSPGPPVTSPG